jgi:uncharacterized protein (DUF433 family)
VTDRITIQPNACHGKPVISSLRYPVEVVLERLGGGMTIDEFLADYPDLQRGAFLTVPAFAARLSNEGVARRPASHRG